MKRSAPGGGSHAERELARDARDLSGPDRPVGQLRRVHDPLWYAFRRCPPELTSLASAPSTDCSSESVKSASVTCRGCAGASRAASLTRFARSAPTCWVWSKRSCPRSSQAASGTERYDTRGSSPIGPRGPGLAREAACQKPGAEHRASSTSARFVAAIRSAVEESSRISVRMGSGRCSRSSFPP